ncbi:hypothetical protein HSUHS1_0918 [Helicobacter suis HS1]|nr:hypothetical protein HSUHS1_0918 [Helicobacter suis HS1]
MSLAFGHFTGKELVARNPNHF